jgi:hypothetical protein
MARKMEAKFEPLEKKDKKLLTSIEMKFFRKQLDKPFLTTKGLKKFWYS